MVQYSTQMPDQQEEISLEIVEETQLVSEQTVGKVEAAETAATENDLEDAKSNEYLFIAGNQVLYTKTKTQK